MNKGFTPEILLAAQSAAPRVYIWKKIMLDRTMLTSDCDGSLLVRTGAAFEIPLLNVPRTGAAGLLASPIQPHSSVTMCFHRHVTATMGLRSGQRSAFIDLCISPT